MGFLFRHSLLEFYVMLQDVPFFSRSLTFMVPKVWYGTETRLHKERYLILFSIAEEEYGKAREFSLHDEP